MLWILLLVKFGSGNKAQGATWQMVDIKHKSMGKVGQEKVLPLLEVLLRQDWHTITCFTRGKVEGWKLIKARGKRGSVASNRYRNTPKQLGTVETLNQIKIKQYQV